MKTVPIQLAFYFTLIWFATSATWDVHGKEANKTSAVTPKGDVIKLFNGRDLTGLYTWLADTKYEDPRSVFSVKDGQLHIRGDGWGSIITNTEYRDYHLVCEFKWGERTWPGRAGRTRDSGVLFHCHGPDGGYHGIWMASIEAQIIEGGVGDILVVPGTNPDGTRVGPHSLVVEVTNGLNGGWFWKKGGRRETTTGGLIQWYGHDPDWKDVTGFRGKNDVESPFGQWTRMDVICDGGHVVIKVNGTVVNEGFEAQPSEGKILFQTEQAEIFVRRWELWPLGEAPPMEKADDS